ncbi:MAG: LuxR C-terminal-related transcriptional regulator [Armatimonadia bacterium]
MNIEKTAKTDIRSGITNGGRPATIKIEGRYQKRPPSDPTLLTEPLLAVLRLMAEGMTGKAIAAALGKDKSTISRQMSAICNRLAAHGREDAVARGRELGLV